jgi:hypothetical protein
MCHLFLSVSYAECHYAERRYAKCHYAECIGAVLSIIAGLFHDSCVQGEELNLGVEF